MEHLFQYLPERLTDALGWTIIHSLWQASAIGILYFLVIKSLSVYHTTMRYTISVVALLSILFTSIVTYIITSRTSPVQNISETGLASVYPYQSFPSIITEMEGYGSTLPGIAMERIKNFVMHFDQLVLIWFAGILVFTIKAAGGFYLIGRYRTSKILAVSRELALRMDGIRQKMNISRPVRFLVSGLAEVPMVTGIFKPVILIPTSVITGLPIAQLEAVLIHELAHIGRHDYFVNLIQSIIEILLFYHPAVWLISRQIRIERELCCDDVSVSACESAGTYVRALASISAMRLEYYPPRIALTSNSRSLYYRIKRILKRNTMKRKYYDRLTAGVLIMAAVIMVILGTGLSHNRISAGPSAINEMGMTPVIAGSIIPPLTQDFESGNIPQDTSITVRDNKITRTIEHADGKTENIDMTIRDGVVQELVIDGKNIPEEKINEYQDLIDQIMNDLNNMEEELRDARKELDGIDFNAIQNELQIECEHLHEKINTEMEHMRQELQNIQIELPEIHINLDSLKIELEQEMKDIQIDREKIRQEMELAMEEARSALDDIDFEKIHEEINKAVVEIEQIDKEDVNQAIEEVRQSIENIDQEKIKQEVQEAIRQMEQIDIQEIQWSVQEAVQDIINEREGVEKEKARIDEMIREIEKLELEEK